MRTTQFCFRPSCKIGFRVQDEPSCLAKVGPPPMQRNLARERVAPIRSVFGGTQRRQKAARIVARTLSILNLGSTAVINALARQTPSVRWAAESD